MRPPPPPARAHAARGLLAAGAASRGSACCSRLPWPPPVSGTASLLRRRAPPYASSRRRWRRAAFLADLTWVDERGERQVQQEIFDAALTMIAEAPSYVLADQFLFNAMQGASPERTRPLASQLTAALAARKRSEPPAEVILITDPINTIYGGRRSPELDALRAAGVTVVETDLRALRDSNPLWSAPWRLLVAPWGRPSGEDGWLPNPFTPEGPDIPLRSWLELINFKANHRKTLVTDLPGAPGRLATLVGSANPHDGSSAHGNVALRVVGPVAWEVAESERAVAAFSGVELPEPPEATGPSPEGAGPRAGRGRAWCASGSSHGVAHPRGPARDPGRGQARRPRGRGPLLPVRPRGDRGPEASRGAGRRAPALARSQQGRLRPGQERHPQPPGRLGAARARADPLVRYAWRDNVTPRCCCGGEGRRNGEERGGGRDASEVEDAVVGEGDGKSESAAGDGHVPTSNRATLILGSANWTRRNLDDFNLETNLWVEAPGGAEVVRDALDYFERSWGNRAGRVFSVSFEAWEESAWWKRVLYRVMEGAGLGTF